MQTSSFLRNMCKKIFQGHSAPRPPEQRDVIPLHPLENSGAHYFRDYPTPKNEGLPGQKKEKPRANEALRGGKK